MPGAPKGSMGTVGNWTVSPEGTAASELCYSLSSGIIGPVLHIFQFFKMSEINIFNVKYCHFSMLTVISNV